VILQPAERNVINQLDLSLALTNGEYKNGWSRGRPICPVDAADAPGGAVVDPVFEGPTPAARAGPSAGSRRRWMRATIA